MRYFFDLDGTLIDSSRRHILVLSAVLSESGFPLPVDRLENFVLYKSHGFSTLNYLTNILGMNTDISQPIAHRWVERIEEAEFLIYDTLYDDVFSVLDSLVSSDEIVFITARKHSESLFHDHVDPGIDESLITYVADRKGHDRRYAIDPEKISQDLGWQPETRFEDGIMKTIAWYLSQRSMVVM